MSEANTSSKRVTRSASGIKKPVKPKPETKSKTVKVGSIGLLDYKVHNVRGDGSCFYRAIYQILRESEAGRKELNIDSLDSASSSGSSGTSGSSASDVGPLTYEAEKFENRGVKKIREYVGNLIRRNRDQDAIETVDNLCNLVLEAGEENSEQLYDDLNEMYPFVTKDVCMAHGAPRYQKVAELIEDMEDLMYASSLEIDIIKKMLESVANLAVIVISYTGKRGEKVEEKWKRDILGLLQNSTKKDVCILLNKNNIHYQYLIFKGPTDETYHTIMDRARLIQLLQNTNNVFTKMMGALSLQGGATAGGAPKGAMHKKKALMRLYSVASSSSSRFETRSKAIRNKK